MWSGSWFNIKMTSYQYRKSHCGDKTILRPSYLHNGISYTGKTTSLYWIRTLYSKSGRCWEVSTPTAPLPYCCLWGVVRMESAQVAITTPVFSTKVAARVPTVPQSYMHTVFFYSYSAISLPDLLQHSILQAYSPAVLCVHILTRAIYSIISIQSYSPVVLHQYSGLQTYTHTSMYAHDFVRAAVLYPYIPLVLLQYSILQTYTPTVLYTHRLPTAAVL